MSAILPFIVQATVALPMPPADWRNLPDLPIPAGSIMVEPSSFVRREVAVGRCRATPTAQGQEVVTTVAVLFDSRGSIARVVPQAIGCPTVEQFTAGYVSATARRLGVAGGLRPGWYRHTVTYRWAG